MVSSAMARGVSVFPLQERSPAAHKCRMCPKSFKRAEHRNRHEQGHSQEKPFACRFCSRRYARSDLVVRHEKTIHRDQEPSPDSSTQSKTSRLFSDEQMPDPEAEATVDLENTAYSLLTPTGASPNQEHLSSFGAAMAALDENSLTSDLDLFEGDPHFFDDLSPWFFDPFHGQVLDHFALPVDDSQVVASEPREATSLLGTSSDPQNSGDFSSYRAVRIQTPAAQQSRDFPQPKQPRSTNQYGLVITEDIRAHFLADLESHLTPEQIGDFQLPETTSLQHCFDSYVKAFHIHFPFLHLPTFDLMATPSPLILGICAIGALHRLERRLAASLCFMAERALASVEMSKLQNSPGLVLDWARPNDSPASDLAPLGIAQARLLLVFFTGFSGQPRLIRQALVGCGHVSADFRTRMSLVKPSAKNRDLALWNDWVEHESVKRYMCTCVVLGNLLNIAYGTAQGFSALQECDIELPVDDALWAARTCSEWETLAQSRPLSSVMGLRKAASSFFSADHDAVSPHADLPPFATSVVMHQVAIAVWYLTQGQQACDGVSQGVQWRQQPEASRVEAALSQCRRLLTRKTSRSDAAWDESDGPLLFNTSAVLRVSYGRAFMTVRFLDRSLLFNESAQDMVDILQRYFEAVQERDQFVTLAVNRALEGFAIPIRAGRMLMRKTAAFKWSVEHVLAGWDAGLLVTKWVHTIEQLHRQGESTAPEERQVLENVRHLLNEGDIECTRTCSLAAELARAWAGLYDDTWVWGVAPRIGWALRELANMYQRHLSGAPWGSVLGV